MKKLAVFFAIIFYTIFSWAMKFPPETRIGIIGAGPSGLVAAADLMEKGYKNVTVLEREDDVGGKVNTIFHEGKPYEMGAVVTAPDYHVVHRLAKELGLKLTESPHSLYYTINGCEEGMFDWAKNKYGCFKLGILKDLARFAMFVWRNNEFFAPGLIGTTVEMHQTIDDFMAYKKMSGILEAVRPLMVGCGYGYGEDMPAPYWLKLIKTIAYEYAKRPLALNKFYKSFTNGWQNLWRELVIRRNIDVRLNTAVEQIITPKNNEDGMIIVQTSQGEMAFDKLIVSVPYMMPAMMELDEEESEIFSRVQTIKYKTTLAAIDNIPQKNHIWLRENSYKYNYDGKPNDGKPVVYSGYHNTNIYQVYQITEEDKGQDELFDIFLETTENIGGELKEIIFEKTFNYFPHFDVAGFADNLHLRLINLQGQKGLYYTGALMNFETVEYASEHARYMVNKYF